MTADEHVEQRLNDLEIKLSFTEDMVDRLNDVIVRQQAQIDLLTREVVQLRDQAPTPDLGATRQPLDEKPPHY